jgi:nitroimidazol reductase NimA-like FMN-containing flavoprotein (pyridoxamine 5'-phosphate oxidase superfamily)
MENKHQKDQISDEVVTSEELITRKEAIKKGTRYMALTAFATFVILNPKQAQAQSAAPGGPGAPGGL